MNKCEGCKGLSGGCNYPKFNVLGECPCTLCLVKPICEKFCKKYWDWETTSLQGYEQEK